MTSPNEVRDILRDSPGMLAFVSADHIRSFNLPVELIKDTNNTVVLITDIRNNYNNFASNHAQGRYSTVQIQAWFSSDSDIDSFQDIMNQVLEDQGWFNTVDRGVGTDPDSLQQFITMQYSKQKKKG